MLVSFDGGNVFRPWKHKLSWLTDSGWWHVDQNAHLGPTRKGKVCVQGFVSLMDANEQTGGLCVIPGSHLQYDDLCQRNPFFKGHGDFLPIPSQDKVFVEVDFFSFIIFSITASLSQSYH